MLTTKKKSTTFSLQVGPSWSSFEKFRTEGAKVLESVKNGIVAGLHTKSGQYRILSEKDFQKLYGLAKDVERLQGSLRVVVSAARAVKKHPDSDTIQVLVESINLLGTLPELPTTDSFEPLLPEGYEVAEDDEVTLEPQKIGRPLGGE